MNCTNIILLYNGTVYKVALVIYHRVYSYNLSIWRKILAFPSILSLVNFYASNSCWLEKLEIRSTINIILFPSVA